MTNTQGDSAEPVRGNKRARIMVLDDDAADRQNLVTVLEKEGYAVQAFPDFESLFWELQQALPDIVVVDAVMPKLSGFEVCREIKAAFQPHPPRVIIVTGKVVGVDVHLAKQVGADDIEAKTSGMVLVLKAVRSMLSRDGKR